MYYHPNVHRVSRWAGELTRIEYRMDEENGWLFGSSDTHGFTVEKGATCTDNICGHQLVVMKSNRLEEEHRPSIGELIVLVRWMVAGTEPQMSHLSKRARLEHGERIKLDFPVRF